jgi:hypothetical protein
LWRRFAPYHLLFFLRILLGEFRTVGLHGRPFLLLLLCRSNRILWSRFAVETRRFHFLLDIAYFCRRRAIEVGNDDSVSFPKRKKCIQKRGREIDESLSVSS